MCKNHKQISVKNNPHEGTLKRRFNRCFASFKEKKQMHENLKIRMKQKSVKNGPCEGTKRFRARVLKSRDAGSR